MSTSSEAKRTFFVTTPIYYVNDVPHIGHAYTTVIADALARFQKLAGKDVFFLTGTDEHGQKIEKAAAEKGTTPKALADSVVGRAQGLWKALDIEYDFFVRTTMDFHEKGVQKLFQLLLDRGDIYKGTYKGWYCVSDENFLADDIPVDADGRKTCPDCGKKASAVSEETYFFRLSAYQDRLLKLYEEHPEFVRPQSRLNEVASFVRGGLKDLSITRTTVKWGIPVPGDPKHTIYVWFDALHNYVTASGYGWDEARFEKFWPADVQLVGKDILRFHAVYWPAFLMAAGLPLPRTIFSHGWWLKDDTKMSKSRGNVLDPHVLLKTFGPDPIRYFLLREIPIGLDGNFSHEGFLHRVNSDLANDFGNLVQRTLTMIGNYFGGAIEAPGEETAEDAAIRTEFDGLKGRVFDHFQACALNKALEEIWSYISRVNKYLADHQPWIMAKDPALRPRLGRVLLQAAAAIRGASYLAYPVMPRSVDKVWGFLGEAAGPAGVRWEAIDFGSFGPGRKVGTPQALFPRVALKDFLGDESAAGQDSGPAAGPETTKGATNMDIITYEEFKKLDLRVARILEAERVPGATRILKLKIDIGTEQRQMVAGVAETYTPEELVGKSLIVICNLKPAVIRGIESQAMLLAAITPDNKALIPFFDRDIAAGAMVK
ncbi:MAG TPA: methionine--tRNA ligase [Candidatus Aminicenantes bacterium]|nr:methionine--tRNA ligase [Candidatus Aminicenantes bacterium]HRY65464.1 methionine--tRNA ligase [Candidatus Aminicenantes bacterium]HRZ72068.1 methionine--tRNA ligase [Candidatus Aminicenantes bacterium]